VRIGAIAVIALACLVALVLLSYAVEALRPRPKRPERFPWNPGIAIQYADLGAIQVRYIKRGSGPNLVSHERRWPDARNEYPRIRIPTLLVYGEQDWAPNAMRERDRASIPGVSMTTVARGGHFLSLDRPRELTGLILQFARAGKPD
jgi:pimeloyl-ACP methyl ester carboxylesterase